MSERWWLHVSAFSAVILTVALAACRGQGLASQPLAIAARPGATLAQSVIEISGFSSAELARLEADGVPATLVRVDVAGTDLGPVAGRISVTSRALEFRPAQAFDANRDYVVQVQTSLAPLNRSAPAVTATVSFPGAMAAPTTTVLGIAPSAGIWPENMLRFYVYFSGAMSRGHGTKYVHLLDDKGVEVPDAILAAFSDLWNTDGTRLTVFFDPGRVKRGIGPNIAMGRAIVAGQQYAIAVDAAWPDTSGQPLRAPFRQQFVAGPPQYEALSLRDWHVSAPTRDTREAVTVRFPVLMDHALLERAIGIRDHSGSDVPGQISIPAGERSWQFVPASPWRDGGYQLVVLTLLEDPAGNKVGRAFEVLSSDPAASAADIGWASLPFAPK